MSGTRENLQHSHRNMHEKGVEIKVQHYDDISGGHMLLFWSDQ